MEKVTDIKADTWSQISVHIPVFFIAKNGGSLNSNRTHILTAAAYDI